MRNIEPATGWAIAIKYRHRHGAFIAPWTIHGLRKEAINAFLKTWNNTKTWKHLYRQGHRAVRVTITVDLLEWEQEEALDASYKGVT